MVFARQRSIHTLQKVSPTAHVNNGALRLTLNPNVQNTVTVSTLSGRVLARFSTDAAKVTHALPAGGSAALLVSVENQFGVSHMRCMR
jgi:hypothetical protein